jgi:DNA-binding CsgD family transcriptional regulator
MPDDKQLDHLIGVLYETALDPSLWKVAIGLCGQYAGGVDGHLLTMSKKTDTVISAILAGIAYPDQSNTDYIDYFGAIDPRIKYFCQGAVDEWRRCIEVNNPHFVKHNEFYQDFFMAYGARYSMTGRIDENTEQYTILSIIRAVGQQQFDAAEQQAAQRFSGHLQRALRLQQHTQHLHNKIELGAMAIDALAFAILIVDDKGGILHLNIGAERLLNTKISDLTCITGKLSASNAIDKSRLAALILAATGKPAVGGAMLLNGEQPRQVFITPLPAASPFGKDWQTPLALVLVIEADSNLSTLKLLGKLYNLTPAELRVASALLAGDSPENYAQQVGVSQNTVRSQLISLFRKTGTRRQSELVALLSRVPPLQD